MVHSTASLAAEKPTTRTKPPKPHADFPLTAHPNHQWCKKVKGRVHFFGVWEDPDAALHEWLRVKDYLLAGFAPPRAEDDRLNVHGLCNRYLAMQEAKSQTGELTQRSFKDNRKTCELVLEHFSKAAVVEDLLPEHFHQFKQALAGRGWSAKTVSNQVGRIRSIFIYAEDLIGKKIKFGKSFTQINKKTERRLKAQREREHGRKVFEAADLRRILAAAEAEPQLHSMILLGVNCGFGNADCGLLCIDDIDLERQIVDYPRPKTGIQRRCWLWPETVAALQKVIATRRKPRDRAHDRLMFVTRCGLPWHVDEARSAITQRFGKLLDKIDRDAAAEAKEARRKAPPKLRRSGITTFYVLRHTFETMGGNACDQVALNLAMGHADGHISDSYRHGIFDSRLQNVAQFVHDWLYGEKGGE